jgi:phenol hydroxylase P0 protein
MSEISAFTPRGRRSEPTECCYVRVIAPDHHGFVEFQFSIGDPCLYLEMTLPPAAFAEFCARHAVVHLSAADAAEVDAHAALMRAIDGE